MNRLRGIGAVSLLAAAALLFGITGCGGGGGGGGGGTIIRGTTDQPVSYDPAGAYDLPSYDVIYNVYQNLLTIPPGGNKPEPEAAQSCDFTNDTTYECTLKDGLKFSDGSPLTAEDVKFSFDRNVKIADPNGASSLLAGMKSVDAPDDKTVVFHLKAPDATWPLLLTVASFAIVPSDVFPKDKLQDSDKVIGSGRYTVASYEPGQQTVLEANSAYTGDDPPKNDRAIVQYFDKSSPLKLAVEQGDVDVAYRGLSPTDLADLKSADGVSVVGGKGIEIRYLAFNTKLQPGSNDAQKLAIRRAVAYTIDRQAIADNVYDGTVQPLYSMVPQGLQYATESFKDAYGDSPDLGAAKAELQKAGVKTPVDLEIWYTPTHYGAGSADEYAEIQHQLEDSGLFNVTLKSTEWNQYSEAAFTDKYPQYQLGWFPDYPDANDYTTPFYAKDSFLNIHYSNPEITKLLADEVATTDAATRQKDFAEIQKIGAEDAPTIPIWQGGQIAAVRDGVNGVEETFDPSFIFRFWLISKN
jgi:peptide/nickel transport system substrate-binding protein